MKRPVIKWALRGAMALVALVAVIFLGVSSGIVSIKASSGHWPITNWFLHYAMERSVYTYSRGVDARKLDEPWLVLKGAGHYETGCRPCHGAPDLRPPVIPAAMTPHPPQLSSNLNGYDQQELFFIVKHGVKFTAMPAWPAQQRDDEVWSVVAFLRALPDLDAQAYRKLVHGARPSDEAAAPLEELVASEAMPRAVSQSCARCHGPRGEGRESAAFPRLAGQSFAYQLAALRAYASGKRHSGIMEPIAAALRAEEQEEASRFYARQRPAGASQEANAHRGRDVATRGIPTKGVPACMECHGPTEHARNPNYPNLAGQYADYIVLQLELFKSNQRGGSAYAHLMRHVAARLNADEMRDVARYYATLSPEAPITRLERGE